MVLTLTSCVTLALLFNLSQGLFCKVRGLHRLMAKSPSYSLPVPLRASMQD